MLDAFRPNRRLTSTAWGTLLVIQAGLLLAGWVLGGAFLLPGPLEVCSTWVRLVSEQGLLHEAIVSLKVNLEAILLSTALAVGFAYLTVLPVLRPVVSLLSKMRFFGLTGFTVVLIMIVGGGHALKVTILTFGMSAFFLTSTAAIVSTIPKSEFDQARTLRMSEWRIVWEVVVLGKADEMFEALRQNASIGWMMLTMAEGLSRTEGGLGALMVSQDKHFHLNVVFAIQLTIFTLGIVQDQFLGWLKNVCCPYANLTLERT